MQRLFYLNLRSGCKGVPERNSTDILFRKRKIKMLKIAEICDHNIAMMGRCPEYSEGLCGINYRAS